MPWFLVLLFFLVGHSSQGKGSAREILDLPRSTAEVGYPVEFTAVVTLVFPGERSLFVHDASAGIYVGTESVPDVEAGDLVMIQGRTGPGRFAPIVRNAIITRIRHAALPNPVQIRSGRLRSNLEGSYVELAATVRSVFQVRNRFQMNLSYGGDPLPALVYSDSRTGMPQPGDLVKVRGVASSVFNAKGQWLGPRLMVQDFASLHVIRAGAEDKSELPLSEIGGLFRYSGKPPGRDQVRVRGAVTCVRPDGGICLQNGKEGLVVRPGVLENLKIGDFIEVAGFPAFNSYSPTLQDATVRKLDEAKVVEPIAVSAADAQFGKYDATLVEMTGTVVLRQRMTKRSEGKTSDEWFLTLRDKDKLFTAELRDTSGGEAWHITPGSKIRVTGVCHVMGMPAAGAVLPYTLWMRSPADLAILKAPSWWTLERATIATAGLVSAIALGLIWLWLLRRKVSRQTSIIRGQLQLETALEERYRDLFENSTDQVFTVDTNGCFTAMNQAAKQTFGCKDGETCCWTLYDFVAPDHRQGIKDILAVLIGGERSILREMSVITARGAEAVLEMNCRLRHGSGGPKAVEIIARDVTQQKREQAALEKARSAAEAASRSKSEFLANMSHEIRTPMNGILGMTELTLDTKLDQDQRMNLEVVKTSAEALLMIINDILDFSKIEAGHMDLESEPFDIAKLVEGCLDLVSLPVAQKEIELVCDIDPALPAEWIGDAARLRQVLINLVGNATKFTHSGEIVVRVDRMRLEGDRCLARLKCAIRASVSQRSSTRAFSTCSAKPTARPAGNMAGLAWGLRSRHDSLP